MPITRTGCFRRNSSPRVGSLSQRAPAQSGRAIWYISECGGTKWGMQQCRRTKPGMWEDGMGRHCGAMDILIRSHYPPFSLSFFPLLSLPHATACLPVLVSVCFLSLARRIMFFLSPSSRTLSHSPRVPFARRLPLPRSSSVLGPRTRLWSSSAVLGPRPLSRCREPSRPCPLQLHARDL